MKKDKYFIEYQCEKCGYKGEQASLQVWEDKDGEVIDSTECCTRCGEYEKFYKWSGVNIGSHFQVYTNQGGVKVKVFSKAKFLTDPGAAMLYQDLPQVRDEIDKLDGQPITEPYIKIGLGDCRIALLPSWCEERRETND